MSVTVAVRLNGVLAELLGARRSMTLPDGSTADDLVRVLRDEAGAELARVVVSVDGRVAGGTTVLADGAAVAVLVPLAGG
jgi:molybdopterin converting factor small subunit